MSRIVFVNAGFPWRLDYPESRPLMLARDLGHDVHTVAYPQPGRPAFEGVTMWASESLLKQATRMRALRPDLVFVEKPGRNFALALLGRRRWVRALERRDRRAVDWPRALLSRGLDAATFTNPHERACWPALESRHRELPYPVDLEFWETPVRREPSFWESRALSIPTGPLVVSIANIVALKQLSALVEWLVPLFRRVPESRLVLPGYPHDREEVARLTGAINEYGLSDNVHLLGQLDPVEVRQLLAWASIHVVNSRRETQCMAMYEGLASGTPTLLFDNPALTSAFPSLPVHRSAVTLLENVSAVLADPAGSAAALRSDAVQDRLRWADQDAHDALFRKHLEELLA